MKKAEKDKALAASLAQIEDTFGPGIAVQMGKERFVDRDCFPTPSLDLNIRLRIGGVPRGMITEIYGKEGGGKSTLCMGIVALAQAQGENAAYVDVEHGFDPTYAKHLGVDISRLVLSQPDYGEQALQVVETLIDGGGVAIVVVDSVAMLTPKAEVEGEIGDANVAPLPRLMAQALRKLTVKVRKQNVALIFINQVRDVIGAVGAQERTSTPGGRALKHNASLRMEIKRVKQWTDGDVVVGARTQAYIKKSRICSPYQNAEFDILYGHGISKETDTIDTGLAYSVVKKDGNTFVFGEEKIGVGREKARLWLQQQPKVCDQIRDLVWQKALELREN